MYERVASGQRINRASDDAASLSVADSLSVQRRLSNTAARNINDGLSTLNVVDGTLDQQTLLMNRLMELAEQSANGTFSTPQRATLNGEYRQLVREFGRLGDALKFNGLSLLRGTRADGVGNLVFQAGVDGSSNARLVVNTFDTGAFSGVFDLSRVATADYDRSGGVPDGGDISAFAQAQTWDELVDHFNNNLASFQTTDSSNRTRTVAVGVLLAGDNSFDLVSFVCNPTTGTFSASSQANTFFANQWVTGGASGGSYSFDASSGKINGAPNASVSDGVGGTISIDLGGMQLLEPGVQSTSVLEFSGVETASRAARALEIVRQRQQEVTATRGQLGAFQARLTVALSLAQTNATVQAGAESRIRDADVGQESAQLVRLQILQRTSAAVLAQASQAPALALTLLR